MSQNQGPSHRRRAESPLLDNLVPYRLPKRRQSHNPTESPPFSGQEASSQSNLSANHYAQPQRLHSLPRQDEPSPFNISHPPHPSQAHLRPLHSRSPLSYSAPSEPPSVEWEDPLPRESTLMPLEVIDLTRESPSPPQRRRQRRPIVIDLDDGDEPEVVARGSGDEVQFVSEQRLPGAPLFWPPQYPPPVRPNRPFHQAHHALSIEPPLLPPSQPAYRHWHQHFFDEARRMMIEQPRGFRPPDLNYGRVSPVAEGVNADYKEPPPAKPGYTHSPEEGDILICAECEHELGTESGKAGGSLVWSGKCGHCYCGYCAVKYQYRQPVAGKKSRARIARCIVHECKINLATKNGIVKIHAL